MNNIESSIGNVERENSPTTGSFPSLQPFSNTGLNSIRRGIFFLVAGPAGVGKTTLLRGLLLEEPAMFKDISVTTRPPREGEQNGVAYHFWDNTRFLESVNKGEFLEHAIVHGFQYGTLARFVEEKLSKGLDVVKDIDVQGVAQVRQLERFRYPQSIAVFVMPPSRDEMIRRLHSRSSESPESFARRLKNAEEEMAQRHEFDYGVVNDSLEDGVAKLKAIRLAEHCRTSRL